MNSFPTGPNIMILARRQRVMRDYLNGITNRIELAARHGITVSAISCDIKWIQKQLVDGTTAEGKDMLALILARHQDIFAKAANEFERSKQNQDQVRTEYRPKDCPDCKGTGMAGDNGTEWCKWCDGEGQIVEEIVTKTVLGHVADAQFLRVGQECQKEVSKLLGLYPSKSTPPIIVPVSSEVHLHKHEGAEVPRDIILKVMLATDELEQAIEQKTIDVDSEEESNDNESE